MTPSDKRHHRRWIRRTSPDAPQGQVAVLVVLVGAIAAIALTASALRGPGDDGAEDAVDVSGSTTVVPADQAAAEARVTTTLIRGSTTLFVTTTTPITTTSSTTTTSTSSTTVPASERLQVIPGVVVLESEGDSATFTVRSPRSTPVGFFVTEVPDGIITSGSTGKSSKSSPARVTLRLDDADDAESGRIVVVGSDGAEAFVEVVVPRGSIVIDSVAVLPVRPACDELAVVRANVSGSASEVRAVVETSAAATVNLTMTQVTEEGWQVRLPSGPEGRRVSGTVIANGADGSAVPATFSYTVTGGDDC